MLNVIEGHFIRGYGANQKPDADIELLPVAVEEASIFFADRLESAAPVGQAFDLIKGFETPFGMELLATVNWVALYGGRQGGALATDVNRTIELVHAWNPREQNFFKPDYLRAAWVQLSQRGWMHGPDGKPQTCGYLPGAYGQHNQSRLELPPIMLNHALI